MPTWWRQLINILQYRQRISLEIKPNELMVRGIVTPLFYERRKSKLTRNAFLPPPGRKEFSNYRNRYANAQQCKACAQKLKLGENVYCGLAVFFASHVALLNQRTDMEASAKIIATPLDETGNPVVGRIVWKQDKGMPFHADIEYDAKPAQEGQPNTPLRKYAEALLQIADYYHDPNPSDTHWHMGQLKYRKEST